MKKRQGLHRIGSFQFPNRFVSENPLEEVWAQIARYGTRDYLRTNLKPEKSDIDWDKHIEYGAARAKQAVELRSSAKNTTPLTSPLTFYYSFLNLTRAFLAIGPEIIPLSYHGLKFVKRKNLLSSGAKITNGTFTDYLTAFGSRWKKGTFISLTDVFSRIIEIRQDFTSIKNQISYVIPVNIDARIRGSVYIDILLPYEGYEKNWKIEFPKLAEKCELESDGKSLIITDEKICESYKSVSKYINENLYPNLLYSSNPLWFLVRETDNSFVFPRAAYYYIAMFILGSIARYQPELMLNYLDSELGWFIQRFINAAERFFTQLKLFEQYKATIYF